MADKSHPPRVRRNIWPAGIGLWASRLAYSPLPPVLLAASFVLSEFQRNITSVYPSSMLLPFVEAAVIGTVPFLVFWKLLRSRLAVTVASLLAVPLFYDYDSRIAPGTSLLRTLTPVTGDASANLLLIAILLAVCWLAGGLSELAVSRLKLNPATISRFLVILVTVSFLYGAASVGTGILRYLPQYAAAKSTIPPRNPQPAATKPDIYYIVLEDYADNTTLKHLYSYDNSSFLDNLAALGLTVRGDALSNYPYTVDSLPSTLQMDYLTDAATRFKNAPSSEFPMHAIFNDPAIAQELKKQGYQYLHVGGWWTDTRSIPSADVNYAAGFQLSFLGLHKTLTQFESTLTAKSVFGRLLLNGIRIGHWQLAGMTNLDARGLTQYQYQTLRGLAESNTQGGRFIFGHIMMPHPPFAYNADGSTPTYSADYNDDGAKLEQKYVAQMRYINTLTQDLVADIKAHAQQPPVIIIQSDEGPHPREIAEGENELDTFDLTQLAPDKLHQKYGILAAYDLPGASPAEMARLDSPVNTFRVVLDHYFGYDLPNLPVCSFAYISRQSVLDFTDITPSLHGGSEDPRCPAVHQ